MTARTFVALALGCFSLPVALSVAQAGSGPASLACTALPARAATTAAAEAITLKGLIPATEQTLDLTLTVGTASVKMSGEAGDRPQVVDAFADRVFTLTVSRKDGSQLRLYALPGTIKARPAPHAMYAKFQAVLLQAPRPGAPPAAPSAATGSADAGAAPGAPDARVLRALKLSCQYDYEV